MAAEPDDWPAFGSELSRKVLTVLEREALITHTPADRIILKRVVDALYDTVTGLVSWEVADLIAQASKELES